MKKINFSDYVFISLILAPTGQFSNLGNLDFNSLASIIISFILLITAIVFFFYLLLGGLKVILSGGKKENLDAARAHLVNAFVGLVIVLSTWAIIAFIGGVFGVNLISLPIGL